MTFKPLNKTRLFQDIVRQIQDQIRDGRLKPGDRLPSERELAEMMQVSRNSLREALRTLEIMNYVEIKPGEGVYIKQVTVDDLLKPLTSAISDDKVLLLDLLDVRDLIEAETARLAAIHASPEDIEQIEKIIESAKQTIDSGGTGLREDSDFHSAVAQATHNTAYVVLMNLIKDSLSLSREATLRIKGQPARTIDDHIKVYKAIRDKDPEKASHLMKEHILKAKKNIIKKSQSE